MCVQVFKESVGTEGDPDKKAMMQNSLVSVAVGPDIMMYCRHNLLECRSELLVTTGEK